MSKINISAIDKTCSSVLQDLAEKHKKQDYKLLTKIENSSNFDEFSPSWGELSDDIGTYSYVKVGKISDNAFFKEVMTLYNKAGEIVKRIFRTNGSNTAVRQYSYPEEDRRIIEFYNGEGRKLATEIQTCRKWIDNTLKKFLSKRINYLTDENNNPLREIIFTLVNEGHKKIASAKILDKDEKKFFFDFKKSGFDNSDSVSKKDKFLLVRFLDPRSDEGLEYLTRMFLNQKHLSKLKINIFPNSFSVSSDSLGYFSPDKRKIAYSPELRDESILSAVNTVVHEVEHAFQYSQIGRLGKTRTTYEMDAYLRLGDLEHEKIEEALKYADARDNYPRFNDFSELSEAQKTEYRENYLEVKAREAGLEAEQLYIKSNVNNYLFFDVNFE